MSREKRMKNIIKKGGIPETEQTIMIETIIKERLTKHLVRV